MIRIAAAIPVAATQVRSRVASRPRRAAAAVRGAGASPGRVSACLAPPASHAPLTGARKPSASLTSPGYTQ
jgi:hypothetical protein